MSDTGSDLESFLPKPLTLTVSAATALPPPYTQRQSSQTGGGVNQYEGAELSRGAAPSPLLSFNIGCALGSFYRRMHARVS